MSNGNVNPITEVILVTGAGLAKPLAYVRIEKSTEEPNEKIDAAADTDYDADWCSFYDKCYGVEEPCEDDCTCGNG